MRDNQVLHLDIEKHKSFRWMPKVTANEAIGRSAQRVLEEQKRWIQQAFLRLGHHFDAGPGTMLQALSFPDARGKGFLEAPQGARAALYWGSILAPLTPRKRGKHGNQGKPRKARKST